MTDSGVRQRLVAVLAGDAVGYSRLMAQNERSTVAALDAARAVSRSGVEASRRRVIDTAGGSVLAVFEPAVDAVLAGPSIRGGLRTSTERTEGERLRCRIGVHLGDVMYGDGVNIAARLHALAEPDGVTVSDAGKWPCVARRVAGFGHRS